MWLWPLARTGHLGQAQQVADGERQPRGGGWSAGQAPLFVERAGELDRNGPHGGGHGPADDPALDAPMADVLQALVKVKYSGSAFAT